MAKKIKSKKLSFRQRLRNDADTKLTMMLGELNRAAQEVTDETSVSEVDLMKLASGSQVKTLKEDLITLLANDHEAMLERIYNNQIDFLPESKDADEKEV